MKVVKVAYNNDSEGVLNVFQDLSEKIVLETFNYDHHKERKHALVIMTNYGTKQLPLIVFEDENLEGYAAIWHENGQEITKDLILKYLKMA